MTGIGDLSNPDILNVKLENNDAFEKYSNLPILPLRDMFFFPGMVLPLYVGRRESINAVNYSLSNTEKYILIATQKKINVDDPDKEDLYDYGVLGIIIKMIKIPDGSMRLVINGLERVRFLDIVDKVEFLEGKFKIVKDVPYKTRSKIQEEAFIRSVKDTLHKLNEFNNFLTPPIVEVLNGINDPGKLSYIIAGILNLKLNEAYSLLKITNPLTRLKKVFRFLRKEIQLQKIQQEILNKTQAKIEKSKKEYFLREQLKAIKEQLGENEEDEFEKEIKEYLKKLHKSKMPSEAKDEVFKQLKRLNRMQSDSLEASVTKDWLDYVFSLPWEKSTKDNLDLVKARKVLDKDHYDLEKIKDRIIEYLAVMKLSNNKKSPILCFVGPPGVGKTSLGKSIASALGRKFVRVSLGGVHDEAEIRGHRKTYVGAYPGKIIQGIIQAGTDNPVFMLDEVDKIGIDFKGDPSSALLEVLDPEQNFSFVDNYIGLPFDLSKVFFIATANITDTIQPAFLDRMEVIYLSGYTEYEKLHIAKKFLVPKKLKEVGLKKTQVKFEDKAILKIINSYTFEAGVRNLERKVAAILRKIAVKIVNNELKNIVVTADVVSEFLGPEKILEDKIPEEDKVGVAIGLAWTPAGGDILFIEALSLNGKGNLILTGHLGEIMQESARAAFSWVKAKGKKYGVPADFFEKKDIHIHVPEGSIPKDGPSAGVTIVSAIVSVGSGRKISKDFAMTGEITLRGDVLPVGGIKEKVLAARRVGIKKIIVPFKNKKDVLDLPKFAVRGLKFFYVKQIEEVLDLVLKKK